MKNQEEKREQIKHLKQQLAYLLPEADLKQIVYLKYKLGKLIEYDEPEYAKELFEDVLKGSKFINDLHLSGRACYRLGKHYEILAYRNLDKSFQEREKLLQKALALFQQSLEIFEQTQDIIRQSYLLHCIASLSKTVGEFELAAKTLEERINLCRASKESTYDLVFALNSLSYIHRVQGKYYSADQGYLESQRLSKQIGNKQGIAFALNNRAIILTLKGKYREALKLYNRSIDIAKTYNGQKDIAYSLGGKGWVFQKQGKTTEALKTYLESLKYFESVKGQTRPINVLLSIADLLMSQYSENDVLEDALHYIRKGCDISQQYTELTRCKAAEADYYRVRYKRYNNLKDFQTAAELYEEVLAGSSFFEINLQVYLSLSTLYLQKYKQSQEIEDLNVAKSFLQKTQRLARRAFVYPMLVTSLNTQAILAAIEFDFETAIKKVRQALSLAQEADLYHDANNSFDLLKQLDVQQKASKLYKFSKNTQETQEKDNVTLDDAISYLEEIKRVVLRT